MKSHLKFQWPELSQNLYKQVLLYYFFIYILSPSKLYIYFFLKTFHIAYTFIETHLRSIWDIYEAREQFFTLQNKKKQQKIQIFLYFIFTKIIIFLAFLFG